MRRTRGVYVAIGAFLIFLWLSTALSWDYDLGFRLKTGELILTQGFPRTDPYSYTMPGFPYVEHAWGVGVIWASLYQWSGTYGIALFQTMLFALTITVTLTRVHKTTVKHRSSNFQKLLSQTFNLSNLQIFIFHPATILAVAVILPFYGIRAHVAGWLAFALLFWIIFDRIRWRTRCWILPVLFFLWANMHGSFLAGLLILILAMGIRTIEKRKIDLSDTSIVVLSTAVTLLNPYGMEIWREVMMTMLDAQLSSRINEWQPAYTHADLAFPAYLIMALVFISKYRNRFTSEEKVISGFSLTAAFWSSRNIPIFTIVSLPLLIRSITYFSKDIAGIRSAPERFRRSWRTVQIGTIFILAIAIGINISHVIRFHRGSVYPQKAVEFIQHNRQNGNIFAPMHWGGYLIFYYPEKKVFVDGRMVSWRWREHPPQELGSAFDDYVNIVSGRVDYNPYFSQYRIETVIWNNPERPDTYRFIERTFPLLEFSFGMPMYGKGFIEQLEKDGWIRIYENETTVIYKKV